MNERDKMVADAAEAVEVWGEDELERFAEEHREEFGREGARRDAALDRWARRNDESGRE